MHNNTRGYMQLHPFHLVSPSPWPMYTAFSLMNLALSLGLTAHNYMNNNMWMMLSMMTVLYSMTLWFRDMFAESTFLGDHTMAVKKGMMQGFLLFVLSEMLMFASLFWAYLHSALNPTMEMGMSWPPAGMETMSADELPLLNTMMLLASGVTITYAHHSIINGNRSNTLYGFIYSTLLILLFVMCQTLEYKYAPFTLTDSVYGSTFYSTTALHGMHMVMTFIMTSICTIRVYYYSVTDTSHVGLETTILYLHVLDVMWLFMYIVMYWWGT
ncbi:cytochrome c oxidase subunit 3 (mitochondrion) [[Candida] anglica]